MLYRARGAPSVGLLLRTSKNSGRPITLRRRKRIIAVNNSSSSDVNSNSSNSTCDSKEFGAAASRSDRHATPAACRCWR